MKKIFVFLLFPILIVSQNKYEFRGAWVASVVNLDWPSSNSLSVDQQKAELIELFDYLESININAVIFQVRTECDALYNSSIEPWSYWLTGKQGRAPNPFYDPLEFAVSEAHKRGLELHAWLNPYRVEREIDNYINADNHVTNTHPEWILTFNKVNIKILNPGIPDVRNYITDIVEDIVTRYDVDGIHFDDYFYPYPNSDADFSGITTQDASTFQNYPRGFTNIEDWRRDNINELMRLVYAKINEVKSHVKFGVSPFGIWKIGVPSGIIGLDAYSSIYCDAVTWLNEQVVDYITPQLYWPFGGGQDYGTLLPWWASKTNGRHLMPGQALYRVPNWTADEIPNQIKLNRNTENCFGGIFFRARNFYSNSRGVTDSLKNNYFRNKAIIPSLAWKDLNQPNPPMNIVYDKIPDMRGKYLQWESADHTSALDSNFMFSVYNSSNITDPSNIINVSNENYFDIPEEYLTNGEGDFLVTAFDRNYNESNPSTLINVKIENPEIPILLLPNDLAMNQEDTIKFIWNDSENSKQNKLQISNTNSFDSLVVSQNSITDTFSIVSNFEGEEKYYWRVSATNQVGESDYSEIFSFTTGFPKSTILLQPADKTVDVPLSSIFAWEERDNSIGYHFQLAKGLSVEPSLLVIDTMITDTLIAIDDLNTNEYYAWQVRPYNQFGFSNWSETFKLLTQTTTSVSFDNNLVTEYSLEQNYPNPFNPTTTIKFSILKSGFTNLTIYNILGEKVRELVNENLTSGNYQVEFNAQNYSSGIYVYVLRSTDFVESKKMILAK